MTGSNVSRSRTRASDRRLRPRSAPDEALDELRGGVGEDGGRGVVLRQDPAALQDGDPVAHLDRLVHVMGDEDDRLAHLLLEAQELVLEPIATDRIDGAEWLVHEHHGRIRREGACHADPLALAARQLVRIPVAIGGRLEADQVEQLVDPVARARRLPAQELGHDRHVVADGEVREEPDLLDHVSDSPPQLDGGQGHDVLAVDRDPATRSAR